MHACMYITCICCVVYVYNIYIYMYLYIVYIYICIQKLNMYVHMREGSKEIDKSEALKEGI